MTCIPKKVPYLLWLMFLLNLFLFLLLFLYPYPYHLPSPSLFLSQLDQFVLAGNAVMGCVISVICSATSIAAKASNG